MDRNSLVFDLSLIGKSHIENHIPKQDYSISYRADDHAILIVCDGHSKSIRSDLGSKFAAEITKEVFSSLFKNLKVNNKLNASFKLDDPTKDRIKIQILEPWLEKVRKHFNENELSEHEKTIIDKKLLEDLENNSEKIYGTTLLAVLITDFYNIYLQIGDGFIVNTRSGMKQEILFREIDDRPPGQTESLSMEKPYSSMRIVKLVNKEIDAVMALTDGIGNLTQVFEHLFELFPDKFMSSLLTAEIVDNTISDLKEYTEHLVYSERNTAADDASFAYYLSNKVDLKQYNLLEYNEAFEFIKGSQNATSNFEFDMKLFDRFNYVQHQHLFNFFNNKKISLSDFATSKVSVQDLENVLGTVTQRTKLTPVQQIKILSDYVDLIKEKRWFYVSSSLCPK